MFKNKISLCAAIAMVTATALADDVSPKTEISSAAKPAEANVKTNKSADEIITGAKKFPKSAQSAAASKTVILEKISKTNETYKAAIDAHQLESGLKLAGKDGAFIGTISKIFETRGGAMTIVNFDPEYKTAMTAMLRADSYGKFPDLSTLTNHAVMVSGTFIKYQDRAEIILTNAAQIKLVE